MENQRHYRRGPNLLLMALDNTLYDLERYIVDILLAITLFIFVIILRYSITFIIVNIINIM